MVSAKGTPNSVRPSSKPEPFLICSEIGKSLKADLHFGSFGRRPKRLAIAHAQLSVALIAVVVLEVGNTSTFHATELLRSNLLSTFAYERLSSGRGSRRPKQPKWRSAFKHVHRESSDIMTTSHS